jgi:hypothetical protein
MRTEAAVGTAVATGIACAAGTVDMVAATTRKADANLVALLVLVPMARASGAGPVG